jgi:multiple sugar transport system permease protein
MVYTIPPKWIPNPINWKNYTDIWTSTNMLTGIMNSTIITFVVLVCSTFTSSMAAFAFSKLNFPFKNAIFLALLSTMMVPFVVILVPQYIIFSQIKWIDTLLPMIVPASLCNMNIIFFLRQYMMGLPNDLLASARIDGCGYFRAYWRIFLPLSKPAIVANIIMLFMGTWNDYFGPMVFTHSKSRHTVQVAIAMLNSYHKEQTNIPLVMAASLIAVLPVIILFATCQKYFTDSFVMTGIKG